LDLANADWGDIAWRSATSTDLVSWNTQHEPTLTPNTAYDGKGVFTGCKVPSRDGSLTCVYTSIGALPIHHTLPHIVGSESLSMAKSFDSGKTWQKFAGNPILPSEPEDLEVTGWRDPFVSSWPSMAAALGRDSKDTLFGIISGGIRDVTPTTFLYAIDANDLTKWQYVGPLVNFGLNLRPSRWSGDLGKNWEVTNFATLKDEKDPRISRDFLVMGTEGCLPSALSQNDQDSPTSRPERPLRSQLWMSGSLKTNTSSTPTSTSSSQVQMQYGFGGHLDHGCLYAANSFFDTKTSKHIVWGWITEEDLCDDLRHEQGWSGLLSLPREIRLQTLENVVRAWKSDLKDITSVECEPDSRGTYTLRTLASEPVQSVVEQLRQKASIRRAMMSSPLLQQHAHDFVFTSDDVQTNAWELDCSFSVSRHCSNIGIQLVHSRGKSSSITLRNWFHQQNTAQLTTPDFSQTTTLSFTPTTETFTITRPSFQSPTTNSLSLINTKPERAPHTLFTTLNPTTGAEETEALRVRVWRDNSVLEVFVNDRTTISTRLYAAEETVGIRFFADDSSAISSVESASAEESRLLCATLWDGIAVS
jgi:beta-fructofuranosidase